MVTSASVPRESQQTPDPQGDALRFANEFPIWSGRLSNCCFCTWSWVKRVCGWAPEEWNLSIPYKPVVLLNSKALLVFKASMREVISSMQVPRVGACWRAQNPHSSGRCSLVVISPPAAGCQVGGQVFDKTLLLPFLCISPQCDCFALCGGGAVQLVFRSFSEGIDLY